MSQSYLVFPQIDPVIFSIGPVAVRWYGLMYVIAFLLANWLANRQADKPGSGWTRDQVSDLLFFGFLGVIVGGRVGYVLFYSFSNFIADPLYLFRTWEGGMSFHGGVLGVMAAMAWFAWRNKKRYLELGDFVVPLLPLGLAFGRLGNFINGELWGRTTDVPWAVLFPNAGMLPRHPSQLYELLGEGIILFILLQLYKRKNPPAGNVAGLFLLGYGTARFIIEFFREPDAHLGLLSLGMSMGQWLCIPMIVAGLGLIVWGYSRESKSGRQSKTSGKESKA